jgi:hypothetical protein
MKKVQNGRDIFKNGPNLPQPSFYLYYIRLRDMKKIDNGSDDNKMNKDPPQPYFYLYYIG